MLPGPVVGLGDRVCSVGREWMQQPFRRLQPHGALVRGDGPPLRQQAGVQGWGMHSSPGGVRRRRSTDEEAGPGASQPNSPLPTRRSGAGGAAGRGGRHSRGTSADLRGAAAGLAALARQGSRADSGLWPGPGLGSGSALGSTVGSPLAGRTPRHSRARSIEAAAVLGAEPQRPAYRTAVLYGALPRSRWRRRRPARRCARLLPAFHLCA
jgi:hypothetical protein